MGHPRTTADRTCHDCGQAYREDLVEGQGFRDYCLPCFAAVRARLSDARGNPHAANVRFARRARAGRNGQPAKVTREGHHGKAGAKEVKSAAFVKLAHPAHVPSHKRRERLRG